MGYYHNNIYSDKIYIYNNNNVNNIKIVNNESISFHFSNFIVHSPVFFLSDEEENNFISEDELYNIESETSNVGDDIYKNKIIIDYGDGTIEKLYNFDKVPESVEHLFSFQDEADFNSTKQINIKIYTVFNSFEEIIINYTIEKQSLQQYGFDLKILSANITNNKEIAYSFNNTSKNEIFFASTKKNNKN